MTWSEIYSYTASLFFQSPLAVRLVALCKLGLWRRPEPVCVSVSPIDRGQMMVYMKGQLLVMFFTSVIRWIIYANVSEFLLRQYNIINVVMGKPLLVECSCCLSLQDCCKSGFPQVLEKP